MTFQEGLMALRDFGFPAGLLIALCFAAWKWGWWLLTEVIKPVSARAIAFFDTLEAQVGTLVGFTTRIDVSMQTHGAKLDSHGQKFDEHGRKLDEQGRKIDELLKSHRESKSA